MGTVAISQFKVHAVKILDQVARTQENIIITRRRKLLTQIVPFRNINTRSTPGKLTDTLVFEKDIISPLGEEIWDVCQ